MDEWGIVLTLTTLIGLFFTVGKPILNLNKNITTLNINIEHNNKELEEQKLELQRQRTDARSSHERLWEHNDKQDEQLRDHEQRLGRLEK